MSAPGDSSFDYLPGEANASLPPTDNVTAYGGSIGVLITTVGTFVQPAVSGTVTPTFASVTDLATGAVIFIDSGGFYSVGTISGSTAVLTNLGYGANATPTSTITTTSNVMLITTGAYPCTNDLIESALSATMFAAVVLPTSGSVPYYGAAYRMMNASSPSQAANPRLYNRAGAIVNTLSGMPSILSTNAGDVGTLGNGPGAGLQVRLMAQVSGVWVPQWINLNGTSFSSDVQGGAQSVDAISAYRWELARDGSPTTIPGDVGCFIGSQLCAIIRGTNSPRRGIGGQGNSFCSAEFQIAVAVSKNDMVAGVNRLTAPASGINGSVAVSAFGSGVFFGGNNYWTGSDQSLAIPGGPLLIGDFFGYAAQFTGLPIPVPLGSFGADIGILCNPGT